MRTGNATPQEIKSLAAYVVGDESKDRHQGSATNPAPSQRSQISTPDLKARLKAAKGMPGYAPLVEEIQKELAVRQSHRGIA